MALNQDKYTYFEMLRPNRGGFSFRDYEDIEKGEYKAIYSNKRDKNGEKTPKRFKFPPGFSRLPVPNSRPEEIEHLERSPFCEGSPNCVKPVFRKVDPEKDAEEVVESGKALADALSHVYGMEKEDLREVACLVGCYDKSATVQRSEVKKYAESNPEHYLEMVHANDMRERAFLRLAVANSIVSKKNNTYEWKPSQSESPQTLGIGEDEAVETLRQHEDILKAIYKAYEKKVKEVAS